MHSPEYCGRREAKSIATCCWIQNKHIDKAESGLENQRSLV